MQLLPFPSVPFLYGRERNDIYFLQSYNTLNMSTATMLIVCDLCVRSHSLKALGTHLSHLSLKRDNIEIPNVVLFSDWPLREPFGQDLGRGQL